MTYSNKLITIMIAFVFCALLIAQGKGDHTPVAQLVRARDLHSRPDIILESYKNAYPDKIKDVIKQDDDWTVVLHDGTIYYWAKGRLLTAEKKDNWEEYRPYQIWAYRADPRDPSTYSEEYIEELRNRTSSAARGTPQLPQDVDFWQELFEVGDRAQTEASLVKTSLFGMTVTVNKTLLGPFEKIEKEVNEIAKTDEEVQTFLDTLSSVSGYSWRYVAGTNRLSNHSYGLAIDMLPQGWGNKMLYWSWVRDYNDDWMLVPQEDLWTPPEKVVQVMFDNGFIWGGTWAIYDTMHFEYKPELIEINKRVIFD